MVLDISFRLKRIEMPESPEDVRDCPICGNE